LVGNQNLREKKVTTGLIGKGKRLKIYTILTVPYIRTRTPTTEVIGNKNASP